MLWTKDTTIDQIFMISCRYNIHGKPLSSNQSKGLTQKGLETFKWCHDSLFGFFIEVIQSFWKSWKRSATSAHDMAWDLQTCTAGADSELHPDTPLFAPWHQSIARTAIGRALPMGVRYMSMSRGLCQQASRPRRVSTVNNHCASRIYRSFVEKTQLSLLRADCDAMR